MKIFVNDKPVKIISFEERNNVVGYDTILKGGDEITSKKLIGHVIIQNATTLQIERLLRILEFKKLKKLLAITFSVSDYEETKQLLEMEAARVLAGMDQLTGGTPTPATRQAATSKVSRS